MRVRAFFARAPIKWRAAPMICTKPISLLFSHWLAENSGEAQRLAIKLGAQFINIALHWAGFAPPAE